MRDHVVAVQFAVQLSNQGDSSAGLFPAPEEVLVGLHEVQHGFDNQLRSMEGVGLRM